MAWFMHDKEVTGVPKNAIGFVYVIRFDDGSKYIGKKNFYTKRKRKFGKKEAALVTDKRKKLYEVVVKESNWREYTSSNTEVNRLIKEGNGYEKRIIEYAYTPKQLTYREARWLFHADVLRLNGDWLNDNIQAKFFKKEVEKWALIKK